MIGHSLPLLPGLVRWDMQLQPYCFFFLTFESKALLVLSSGFVVAVNDGCVRHCRCRCRLETCVLVSLFVPDHGARRLHASLAINESEAGPSFLNIARELEALSCCQQAASYHLVLLYYRNSCCFGIQGLVLLCYCK